MEEQKNRSDSHLYEQGEMLPELQTELSDYSHIHLLIVEDLPDNLELVKLDLQDELPGVRISEAMNGLEAIEKLKQQDFTVVVCDVLLPGMDGYDVLVETRKIRGDHPLPFLFLSALHQEHLIKKGLALGAVDFVTKPYDPHILAYKIKNLAILKIMYEKLRAAQKELQRVNRFLQKLNEEKNMLLRLAAHDLRSPLSGIRGLARILQMDEEANDPKTVKEFAQLIEQTVDKIFPVIDELSMVAHTEFLGREHFQKTECAVDEIVKNSLDLIAPIAQKKNAQFQLKLDSVRGHCDATRLLQLFSNLHTAIIEFVEEDTMLNIQLQANSVNDRRQVIYRLKPLPPSLSELLHSEEQNFRKLPQRLSGLQFAQILCELFEGSLHIIDGDCLEVRFWMDATSESLSEK